MPRTERILVSTKVSSHRIYVSDTFYLKLFQLKLSKNFEKSPVSEIFGFDFLLKEALS
jgi:hypothetical protein